MPPEDPARQLETDTRLPDDVRVEADERLVPGLTVLWHPDVVRVGERVPLPSLAGTGEQPLSRLQPELSPPGRPRRRPLTDPHLSRTPLRLAGTGDGGVKLIAAASPTRVEAHGAPVSGERAFGAAEVERGVVLLLAERVVVLLHRLDPLGGETGSTGDAPGMGMVGASPAMDRLRRELAAVAELEVPVLLRGETGTGKELAARALHRAGRRRGGPYLTVNMAAIPPTLAAAELFGAARGAFTGADRKREGYFLRAHGGSLFLDEIGETPPEVQPLLLRALESGEIQPVGADATRRADVRLIAATDAALERAVAEGRFRAPLLHRLAAYPVRLPPLRERRDDVGRLLLHFLQVEAAELGSGRPGDGFPGEPSSAWLPAPLVARLAAFDWPGNVRQLRNAVRRLLVTRRSLPATAQRGEMAARLAQVVEALVEAGVEPGMAPAVPAVADRGPSSPAPRAGSGYRKPSTVSEPELLAALEAEGWNLQAAADRLGVSRASLYTLIERSDAVRVASDLEAGQIAPVLAEVDGDVVAAAARLRVSEAGLRRQISRLGLAVAGRPAGEGGP